ncbi:MAG TPA: transmembrane 220 family protein [Cyclobacteriaceae bacterium]|nr:transmembrane 220 family protein [Cyclobacteriaceae bacterium]
MRILSFALTLMFIAFAFVQVNDPDPIIWILIYGAMAVVCLLAAFNIFYRKVMIGLLIFYVAYSIYYFPGVREWLQHDNKALLFDNLAKMQFLYIEEAREFLGLMINVAVLVFYLIRSRSK